MSYPTLLDLEGLALNGFVKEAELVDCELGTSRKSKLKVKLYDGRLLETECFPYERVVRSYLVVVKYLEFGKIISSKQVDEKIAESLSSDTSGEYV
ncbi:MAG: hypothetical protein QXT76_04845 [Sulfolobales archaeon]